MTERANTARWLVPALIVSYLICTHLFPSHWFVVLLGAAVLVAARTWSVRGGVGIALAIGPALTYGLWRMAGVPAMTNPLVSSGYGWTWVSLLVLGALVGHLTHQTREMVRINAELRQAQQRLEALHHIATSLSSTLDVRTLMDTILEQLGHLWGYDYGSILLLDDATGELLVAAERGYDSVAGKRLAPGEGITGEVVRTGAPVYVPDVTCDPRYYPGVPGARSELAVPLIWNDQVIGVLNVETPLRDAYGPSDLTLLTTVAEQAAASLGNARLHERTQRMAITDPHTGLHNYRHFQDRLTTLLRDAQLTGGQCSLIMLDLDHFKRYNDTYGHPTGDSILQQMARVLRDSTRHEDLVFRYGGEEFAVLLPGTPHEAAMAVGERIRERVAGHSFITASGRRVEMDVTASVGVATYPAHGLTPIDLVLTADKALYLAKAEGRNRVRSATQTTIPTPA